MAGRSQSQNTDKPRFGYFVSMSIPKPYNESSLSLTSSHSAWLASMNVGRLDLDELVSGMSINSTKAKQRLDDMLIKHINPPPSFNCILHPTLHDEYREHNLVVLWK